MRVLCGEQQWRYREVAWINSIDSFSSFKSLIKFCERIHSWLYLFGSTDKRSYNASETDVLLLCSEFGQQVCWEKKKSILWNTMQIIFVHLPKWRYNYHQLSQVQSWQLVPGARFPGFPVFFFVCFQMNANLGWNTTTYGNVCWCAVLKAASVTNILIRNHRRKIWLLLGSQVRDWQCRL